MSNPTSATHLSPEFLAEMIDLTCSGVALPPGASPQRIATRHDTVRLNLLSFDPRTVQEVMLASQITLAQFAAMECFARIIVPDTAEAMRVRQHNNAAAMLRLCTSLNRELERCKARRRDAAAESAQPASTLVARPTTHAAQPTPASRRPIARPAVPTPQPPWNNPMPSGKLGSAAAFPSATFDPAAIMETARKAVAAAMNRVA